jgi:hypothetical protein
MMFNENLISYLVRLAVFEKVGNTLGHYHSAPWLLRYTFMETGFIIFSSSLYPFKTQISNSDVFYLLGTLLT